jgi:hypothetical protein
MIASALRTEIQQFCAEASVGRLEADLARRALAAHRTEGPAAVLAYEALCEYLSAQLGLEGASLDRFEGTLDAIDDLVEDPAELPVLREQLRRFCEQLEQTCQEANRAPRRKPERHVSAA